MRKEGIILGGIGLLTVIIVVGAALFLSQPQKAQTPTNTITDTALLLGPEKDRETAGTPSAKVTIVEFGDYQCPACGSAHPIVKQILEDYKDKVYFVFRNFPLPMHQNAPLAAYGALAAADQDKFWEMHDMLYENQEEWSESGKAKDIIIGYAQTLGLDVTKFTTDINAEMGKSVVTKDQNDGYQVAVNSTPTFFINGEKFPGVLDYDQFKAEIDKRLK